MNPFQSSFGQIFVKKNVEECHHDVNNRRKLPWYEKKKWAERPFRCTPNFSAGKKEVGRLENALLLYVFGYRKQPDDEAF